MWPSKRKDFEDEVGHTRAHTRAHTQTPLSKINMTHTHHFRGKTPSQKTVKKCEILLHAVKGEKSSTNWWTDIKIES